MSISPGQARAAQALLGLKQKQVCEGLGINRQSLSNFENTGKGISAEKKEALQQFYEDMGVEFLDYEGVRKRPSGVHRVLRGMQGFREFMNDVYSTVREGGDICVTNVDERQFERWQGGYAAEYLDKMAAVKKLRFRAIVQEGDDYFTASRYAEYRSIKQEHFTSAPTYVYGDKKAEILFLEDDVQVILTANKLLSDAQRRQFELVWEKAQPLE